MPLHGDEVARKRIGKDEWIVRFASLAIMDHVWNFRAYKANEEHEEYEEENLFWSPKLPGFVPLSRNDVPTPVLNQVEDWIQRVVRAAS
ncbi:MAG TPA: hypothetical protein VI072_31275 [Polyangiaceae bacterium]